MSETTCAFEGCERPDRARLGNSEEKYCSAHYQQWMRGKELAPIRTYGTKTPDPEGLRVCSKCEQAKTDDEFYKRANGTLTRQCRTCMIAANVATNKARRTRKAS